MISWNAWKKRMTLAGMTIAAMETCQFSNTRVPSRATAKTMTVAIVVARQATARRNAGSVPWVNCAKGAMALSGPRVKKKIIKASEIETCDKGPMQTSHLSEFSCINLIL